MLEINLAFEENQLDVLCCAVWTQLHVDDLIDVTLKNVFQTKNDWIVFGVFIKTFFGEIILDECVPIDEWILISTNDDRLIITLYIHRQHSFPHLYFPTTFWIYVFVCWLLYFFLTQFYFNWIEQL